MDLRDLWRDPDRQVSQVPVTPRLVLWLVEQLPADSAFAASVQGGGEFRAWPLPTLLMARAVNELSIANQQRAGRKRPKPVIDPPSKKKAPARVVRIADIIAARDKAAQTN